MGNTGAIEEGCTASDLSLGMAKWQNAFHLCIGQGTEVWMFLTGFNKSEQPGVLEARPREGS